MHEVDHTTTQKNTKLFSKYTIYVDYGNIKKIIIIVKCVHRKYCNIHTIIEQGTALTVLRTVLTVHRTVPEPLLLKELHLTALNVKKIQKISY